MTQNSNHPYEDEGYAILCKVNDQMEADLLLDELAGAGMDALQYPGSEETSLNFPPSETSGGICILVKEAQLDEAKGLYEKLESGNSMADDE